MAEIVWGKVRLTNVFKQHSKSSANRRDAEALSMEINQITEKIIGAAIEIHKTLG